MSVEERYLARRRIRDGGGKVKKNGVMDVLGEGSVREGNEIASEGYRKQKAMGSGIQAVSWAVE